MRCPFCSKEENKVIDTRESTDSIRRRRECLICGKRFTTYERIAQAGLMVIKQDSRREIFDRQKLMSGIIKACAKRPISMESIEAVVDKIEHELHAMGKSEVDSQKIGQLVMENLRTLDDVAFVRFASVYRNFREAKDFETVLGELSGEDEPRPAVARK